eukprot:355756-Rhodomonas_salina.1
MSLITGLNQLTRMLGSYAAAISSTMIHSVDEDALVRRDSERMSSNGNRFTTLCPLGPGVLSHESRLPGPGLA